ncbi:phosphatase PAP2 family protein [Streptomyces sp. NBC_01500]|uniref:phosphatase PAP2 family protein n=1 Tax=Streptomyces sp. NBC_01500 TaxID=2903886 RepID=UPI002254471F|nr:phosphatase PAP2 family protein [Streptomyces sp. NBC_01500]MCX4547848.1 phosphatase PAP2 family protein [Streptomyces sp. NBC_01500]
MRETPRSQVTVSDSRQGPPQLTPGCAFAHTTGASDSGSPHRSDGRSPHTPRGARHTGPGGRPGTTPPVPGRPASLPPRTPLRRVLFSALGCAVLFALITWQVMSTGPLLRLDVRVDHQLVGTGPGRLSAYLSDLGNAQVAVVVLVAAMAYALWRGSRFDVLAAGLAMAAVPALVVPLKLWVARPGPLDPSTGYFPSGHTATAMVAYGGAALLVTPYTRRNWPVPAAVVLTLATSTGLVLHGYHWPLDVVASWCLCGALLLISSTGMRRSSSRTPPC